MKGLIIGLLLSAAAYGQVTFTPSTSGIAGIVTSNPTGTVFVFQAGTYHNLVITALANDQFVGQPGAILSGSQALTSWTASGQLWFSATGVTVTGPTNPGASCDGTHPMCNNGQDLFYDNQIKLRVASQGAVVPGTWYLDYATGNAWVADNPAGHTIEMSVTTSPAIGGSVAGVVVTGFIIEKYAVPAQTGAVTPGGAGWNVANNEIRYNHGDAVEALANGSIVSNFLHHNGHKGLGAGSAANFSIIGNEVSFNNQAGFNCAWECGGVKLSLATNYTFQTNYIHDNVTSPGYWDDIGSTGFVVDSNVVVNNGTEGMTHEIGYAATFSNNTICYNYDNQGSSSAEHAGIFLNTSQSTSVYGNTIVVNAGGSNIVMQSQSRTGGTPAYNSNNNSITGNIITALRQQVSGVPTGRVVFYYDPGFLPTGTTWNNNAYHHVDFTSNNYWVNTGTGAPYPYLTFAQWQSPGGFDTTGTNDGNLQPCSYQMPKLRGFITGGGLTTR